MSGASQVPAISLPLRRKGLLVRALAVTWLSAVFFYAAFFALEVILSPPESFDESITILAARAVQKGMTPHGDFWIVYPALSYWIIAGAFGVSNNSYFIARAVSIAFYGAVLAVGWMVAAKWRSRIIVISGLILSIGCFYWYAPWNAFALLLMILLLFCWKRTDTSSGFWMLIGLLLTATMLTRLNFAAYGFMAVCAFVLLNAELDWREKMSDLTCLCVPMALGVLIYCFICRNCLPALYAQMIYFPTHAMMRERILLMRPLTLGLFLLPFALPAARMWRERTKMLTMLAFLTAVTSLVFLDLRSRQYVPRPAYAFAFAAVWMIGQVLCQKLKAEEFTVVLCYFLFLHYYLARADLAHVWPAITVLLILVVQKLSQWPITAAGSAELLLLASTVILGIYLCRPSRILVPNLSFYRYAALRVSAQGRENLNVELNFPPDGEAEALDYLMVHTTADEYVYSGLLDHAGGYTNNLRAYVILQRRIPVSDWQYEPGYSSEAQNQQLAIEELERTHTNWLLLWRGERNPNEIVRRRQGSSLLDTYIRGTFCLTRTFGDYQVWRRCSWSPLSPP